MAELTVEEKLKKLSRSAEMMLIGAMFSNPELYYDYVLDKGLLMKNGCGSFYYAILKKLIVDTGYQTFDRLTLNTFISKQSEKLREMYNRFGGFETLMDFMEVSEPDNIEQYYLDVLKYSALRRLNREGFNLEKKWDHYMKLSYKDMANSIEQIVSDTFSEANFSGDKVVDLKYGMREMIQEIKSDKYTGLPVASNLLNKVINGLTLGDITLMAGMSGAGKTFLTINLLLPVVIQQNVPILIMCNEEDANKWRWSILVWIANNIIVSDDGHKRSYLDKARMFDGKFTPEDDKLVKAAIEWYEKRMQDKIINFVSFSNFSTDKAIRMIKQYSSQYNVKYFILDTFKLDNDAGSKVTDQAWLQLQQNIVKIYNVIKESSRNCHVWITYQLNKTNKRYLDQSLLGMSRNVADVVSTLILARRVYENEKGQGKESNIIKVKNSKSEYVNLSSDEDYMILFIDKNRSGSTSQQVVIKTDKGRNIIRDVGYTQISEDF
ncbi:TPA: DnaB-like helicase C-terminal domain-containing protein [Streptococcus suis]